MADTSGWPGWGDAVRTLEALVEASDAATIGCDLDGVVRSWNPAAERVFGYSASEVIGRGMAAFVPPDRANELGRMLDHVGNGRKVGRLETVWMSKDGRHINVSVSMFPLQDAGGRVTGGVTLARDVGARLQTDLALRLNEARWRAIIDSAVDGIIVIDAEGRIETFNAAAERMFGYTEQEVVGQNVSILMPAPYRDEHNGYLERYLTTGEQKIIGIGREVTARRRDGRTFPVHLSVGEAHVGSQPRFTGILHDLSARAELEQRLREQSALARVGEMAAVIAHEVRNPLTAVRGAIQVIGGRLPPESRDAPVVQEVIARLDALNTLINDLLLFARPPQLKRSRVELVPLLRLTADLLARDPSFHGVHVAVSGTDVPLTGDPDLLKIVFQNLFINAAQAMNGQGRIDIALAVADGQQRITVIDKGPGIPPEVQAQLFRPFFTTKARGTGLGLSTAKRLVEAHDGRLSVACPPEGGTAVRIELPIESPPTSPA